MNNEKKNITALSKVILSFVLAALMIFALFLPIVKVGTYEAQFSADYTGGVLTQYAVPVGDCNYGAFTIINVLKNYKDIYTILKIQTLDAKATAISSEISEIYNSMLLADEEELAAIEAEIEALAAELE